jgi:hypothetical protein
VGGEGQEGEQMQWSLVRLDNETLLISINQ